MLELVPALAGRAHAGPLRCFMHMLVIALWTQTEASGGSGGTQNPERNAHEMITPHWRPSPPLGLSAHSLTGAHEAPFFSGHSSLLSVHSDLTNLEFLQVPGTHQVLTSRSKVKEKLNPETLILYLLFTQSLHLAQFSLFSGFRLLPPRVSLPPFPCIRLCLLWGLSQHTPSLYCNYLAFPRLKLSACTLFYFHSSEHSRPLRVK